MARRSQKQTWAELRPLFVSGWSLGKLAKRFAVLIGMGIATAQTSAQTPPARQIERDKEAMRRAARSAPVKLIGSPTLVRLWQVPILLPALKKLRINENRHAATIELETL
jgi:hypothetical protein